MRALRLLLLVVVVVASGLMVSTAFAQQPKVFRIGWLSADLSENSPFFEAFRSGMRNLGYVEDRNVVFTARWGEGSTERLGELAAELVQLKPHIIVTQGGATVQMMKAGAAAPVVFGYSGDPVEAKLVESLAKPGRNFTGVSFLALDLVGKRMEVLKELMPAVKRVAVIGSPEHPGVQSELRASQAAAKKLGVALDFFEVRNAGELESAFAGIAKSRSEAIVLFPDAITVRHRERISALASKIGVPTVSGWAQFADSGSVLTYGPNLRDSYARLAVYVDKILKGAAPADLPVELPTTVEVVVNQKSAKALGITVPQSVLLRANRVID